MREVLPELMRWYAAGEPVALARVVGTVDSAPRPPGASMLVGPAGEVVGSLSGGCVEGAVLDVALDVLAGGDPSLARYGVADDEAWAVGLTCGGSLEVYAERVDRASFPALAELADDVEHGRAVALATVVEHPGGAGARVVVRPDSALEGSLGSARIDAAVLDDARGLLAQGRSEVLTYGPDGERRGEGLRVFVHSLAPAPRMLVFGATDFAAATARVGALLGYRVTVCDARAAFATRARFPDAHEVVVDWPHRWLAAQARAGAVDETTAVCVLTHDPKFDAPLLEVALRLPAVGFVGAMGSRRAHDDRLARLRDAGLTEAELTRLSSPVGLDLGARTPEETAVSIAAEIVAGRWGGSGARLSETTGRIHREQPSVVDGLA